jgi:hypothetical protein
VRKEIALTGKARIKHVGNLPEKEKEKMSARKSKIK